jgi:uncharacterized damage-inducible protein DinB
MGTPFEEAYLKDIRRQYRAHKTLAERAMQQVSDADFQKAIDPESNSIALIVKHMAGNLRSRFTDFLTTDGEKPTRNRDAEFELAGNDSRAALMSAWESGWTIAFASIDALQPEDLLRTVTMRNEPMPVVEALNRLVNHAGYHAGQIAFLAKHFVGADWQTLTIPKKRAPSPR